jgi:hypothetical protein
MNPFANLGKKAAVLGAIGVFFPMALEVVIMISPFAFFFYAVFNPVTTSWPDSMPPAGILCK